MPGHLSDEASLPVGLARNATPHAAFQGIEGAFGDDAVQRVWQGRVRAYPTPTFEAALDAVLDAEVEWAVIPLHNSTIGDIEPACRALAERESSLVRVDEVIVPVRHCLLTLPGTTISRVRYVGSHPAALAQCGRLFREQPDLTACEAFDTAGSARELAEFDRGSVERGATWYSALGVRDGSALAVLAGERAAARYGLVVLRKDLQDRPDNATRFVVVRAAPGVGR
jgi:prephenate dehydratase